MEDIALALTVRHVPRRNYPADPARTSTLAFWSRLFNQAPRYKDPHLDIVSVGTLSDLHAQLFAAKAYLTNLDTYLVRQKDGSWKVEPPRTDPVGQDQTPPTAPPSPAPKRKARKRTQGTD